MFIFETERESTSAQAGEGQREGDTESETGSRLRAVSTEPDAGLELTDCEIVTWLKSDASPTGPPRRPLATISFQTNSPNPSVDHKTDLVDYTTTKM